MDPYQQNISGHKFPEVEGGNRATYYFFTQTCNSIPNYASLSRNLTLPVRVTWGEEDKILQGAPQAQLVKKDLQILDSEIFVFSERKHFIPEESPQ